MPASMKHIVSVPWSDQERDTLRQMWENGIGCTGIGRHLGRSKYSVRSEIETLNLGTAWVPRCRPRHSRHHRNRASDHHNRCDPAPARCRRCRVN